MPHVFQDAGPHSPASLTEQDVGPSLPFKMAAQSIWCLSVKIIQIHLRVDDYINWTIYWLVSFSVGHIRRIYMVCFYRTLHCADVQSSLNPLFI